MSSIPNPFTFYVEPYHIGETLTIGVGQDLDGNERIAVAVGQRGEALTLAQARELRDALNACIAAMEMED